MNKTFTVIIRSNNKTNENDNTNDCAIKIYCPSYYSKIRVLRSTVFISTDRGLINFDTDYFEIRSPNFNILSGTDTQSSSLNTIGFHYLIGVTYANHISFEADNFNNKTCLFQLYGSDGTLLKNGANNYNEPWVLILSCEGIE